MKNIKNSQCILIGAISGAVVGILCMVAIFVFPAPGYSNNAVPSDAEYYDDDYIDYEDDYFDDNYEGYEEALPAEEE